MNCLRTVEHTWGHDWKRKGRDEKTGMRNIETSYERSAFETARSRGEYSLWEESWREQEAYVEAAAEALQSDDIQFPTTTHSSPEGTNAENEQLSFEVDTSTGQLSKLSLGRPNRKLPD